MIDFHAIQIDPQPDHRAIVTVVEPPCTTVPPSTVTKPVGYDCTGRVGRISGLAGAGGGVVGTICGATVVEIDELDCDAPAFGDGVNTITVPSTVVRKFKNPRTVTVGNEHCNRNIFIYLEDYHRIVIDNNH
ncbi:hypothetical protein BLOT_005539 [Blomia tropicalis]|nr:hypothetical protein BLOT_005539 [Blomia tropicalis]